MTTDSFFENFGIPRLAMATVQVTNIPLCCILIFSQPVDDNFRAKNKIIADF